MQQASPVESWRVTLGLEECYVSGAAERILTAVVDRAGRNPVSCMMLALELFEAANSEADAELTRFGLGSDVRRAILSLACVQGDRAISDSASLGSISITARLRRVLARSVNNGAISTGGLLIGLLSEDGTRLVRLCAVMGLTAESVSASLKRTAKGRR